MEKLVALGLAEETRPGQAWRCKLSGDSLAECLTWFDLYGTGFGIFPPMGVVIATHPEKGDHYVKVVSHQALSKGVYFMPVATFPHGNSIPYRAYREELKAWRLVKASAEDCEAPAAGLFKWAHVAPIPSKLDDLAPEVQLIAQAMLDAQANPIDPAVEAEHAEIARRLAATGAAFIDAIPERGEASDVAEIYLVAPSEQDKDFEIPELTGEILAKIFANMMANGMEGVTGRPFSPIAGNGARHAMPHAEPRCLRLPGRPEFD